LGNNHGTQNIKDITGVKKYHLTPVKRLDTKSKNGSYEWLCLCDCGNICISNITDLNSGRKTRCDSCSQFATISKGEEQICKLLQDNSINYIQQKMFDSCIFPITKKHLKFDFYIPD
jgi:hypothetical protein